MPEVVELAAPVRVPRLWMAAIAWSAVVAVFALTLRVQDGLPLSRGFASAAIWYYSLGVLVWIACALDVRWRLFTRTTARRLAVHGGLGLVATAAWAAFVIVATRLMVGPAYWRVVFGDWWMFQLLTSVMIYAAGVGTGLAVQAGERERERQQREAQLEVLAREAELAAIKAQLQPHFLFNSLNSILALIEHDPREAARMLTRLSSMLRAVFDRLDEPLVTLERELDTIRDYLDIERIRFGDRLTFSIEAESAARETAVPPFLLQPLVENAVKHGIEPYPGPGSIRVTGRIDGARLRLIVADNGAGMNGTPHRGHGLALTQRRLQAVYGADATSLTSARGADGFTVTIDLPVPPNAV